jgi:uncharacterized membrane protein YdjX (TVP38/TMEM64 family)
VLGSLPWTFALALVGDAVASHWKSVESGFTVVTVVVAVVVVAIIVRWLWSRRRASTGGAVAADEAPESAAFRD